MNYRVYLFRHAKTILEVEFLNQYEEIKDILSSITESDIKLMFREIWGK